MVKRELSPVECTVAIMADDSESALYLARVILRGHTAPQLHHLDEPEEEAPAPKSEGSKARPIGKGRASVFAPDLR